MRKKVDSATLRLRVRVAKELWKVVERNNWRKCEFEVASGLSGNQATAVKVLATSEIPDYLQQYGNTVSVERMLAAFTVLNIPVQLNIDNITLGV